MGMKYFIPIFSIGKDALLRGLRFYEVRIRPMPQADSEREEVKLKEQLLWNYVRVAGIVGFPSEGMTIGVLRGNPESRKVRFRGIKYEVQILREVHKDVSPQDIIRAVSAYLSNIERIKNKGYVLDEKKIGGLAALVCANLDIYVHDSRVFLAVFRDVAVEGPTLDWIIRKLGREKEKLVNRKVRNARKYYFTKKSGVIKKIFTQQNSEYGKLWNDREKDYRKNGGEKWKWFKKQQYGTPIVEIEIQKGKSTEHWLATALTLQFYPENYDLFKKLYPEAFEEISSLIHLRQPEILKELTSLTNRVMEIFRERVTEPKRVELSEDGDIFKPYSIIKLRNPELKFSEGTSGNPLDVFKLKPIDLNERKFQEIHIFTSYDFDTLNEDEENRLGNFLHKLKYKLEEMGVRAIYHLEALDPKSAVQKASEKSSGESRSIVLQILPERDESPGSPYAVIRRLAYEKNIPVQTILKHRLQQKWRPILNNLAVAIYAKVGGRPWALEGGVSEMLGRALYIGYDISRRAGGEFVGTAVVYDSKGQFLFHYPYRLPTKPKSDIIPREHIKAFIEGVIRESRRYGEVDAVVLHKDGEVRQEEMLGVLDGIRDVNPDMTVIIAGFPKTGPFIFEDGRTAGSGIAMYASNQLVDGRLVETYLIQTREPWGKGALPVAALKVRLFYYGTPEKEKPRTREFLRDFLQQIYNLSRLNWSTLKGVSKAPVTVHYAHKASKILSYGISPERLDRDKLYML